jgi:hypothetical protein
MWRKQKLKAEAKELKVSRSRREIARGFSRRMLMY